ncbi:MAG: lysophospholipid acyltransferase family protein [Actinomycetota bacterium]|nr:lysophospholipid acyltransferase family protein [Actinomycetota bacterium]
MRELVGWQEDPEAPARAKPVALADVYRIPLFAATKLLYAVAPIALLFRLANLRGAVDSVRSPLRAELLVSLERHLGPTMSEEHLRLVARRHFEFYWRGRLARIWPQIRSFTGAEAVEIEGLDHLDDALAAGRGAIIVSTHFGHARLIKPILRLRKRDALLVGVSTRDTKFRDFPQPFTRLGGFVHKRLLRLPPWSRYEEGWRETVGDDLGTEMNLRPHLAALRRNQLLIMLGDGRGAHALWPVPVLGVEAYFSPGPVSIARSAGVPVLPAFVVDDLRRKDPVGLRLVIHPPLGLQVSSDARHDLEVNIRRFAAVFEEQARTHPHNWHWTWVRGEEDRLVPYVRQFRRVGTDPETEPPRGRQVPDR